MNPIATADDNPSYGDTSQHSGSSTAASGLVRERNRKLLRGAVPQSLEAAALPDALLKIQTVTTVTALSASSIFRKVAANQFPQPVRLGRRCTRWRAADVRAWLAAQTTHAKA